MHEYRLHLLYLLTNCLKSIIHIFINHMTKESVFPGKKGKTEYVMYSTKNALP